MSDVVVETRRLTKTYVRGKVETPALRGVDLKVFKGEIVSIMGPSGCGKTTLLNLLGGLDKPTSGEVYIDGKEITGMKDSELTRFRLENIGFVFQFFNLIPTLTAFENVELPMLIAKKPRRERKERVSFLLRSVGLEHKARSMPYELSGGEQQRVAIARALANNPSVVLADEPTGNLDSRNSLILMDLINRLNEDEGQTFIIVTHDQKVAEMTDRTLRMIDGKIIPENKQHQLRSRKSEIDSLLNELDKLYVQRRIDERKYRNIRSEYIKSLVEIEIATLQPDFKFKKEKII